MSDTRLNAPFLHLALASLTEKMLASRKQVHEILPALNARMKRFKHKLGAFAGGYPNAKGAEITSPTKRAVVVVVVVIESRVKKEPCRSKEETGQSDLSLVEATAEWRWRRSTLLRHEPAARSLHAISTSALRRHLLSRPASWWWLHALRRSRVVPAPRRRVLVLPWSAWLR